MGSQQAPPGLSRTIFSMFCKLACIRKTPLPNTNHVGCVAKDSDAPALRSEPTLSHISSRTRDGDSKAAEHAEHHTPIELPGISSIGGSTPRAVLAETGRIGKFLKYSKGAVKLFKIFLHENF